jgi:hypothetical protein
MYHNSKRAAAAGSTTSADRGSAAIQAQTPG